MNCLMFDSSTMTDAMKYVSVPKKRSVRLDNQFPQIVGFSLYEVSEDNLNT